MERIIDGILRDLYRIDPALRDREEDVKKVIRGLIEARPDAKMDEEFERELKNRLLERFPAEKKRRAFSLTELWSRPAFRAAIGLATAAGLALVVTTRFDAGRRGERGMAEATAPISVSRPETPVAAPEPGAADDAAPADTLNLGSTGAGATRPMAGVHTAQKAKDAPGAAPKPESGDGLRKRSAAPSSPSIQYEPSRMELAASEDEALMPRAYDDMKTAAEYAAPQPSQTFDPALRAAPDGFNTEEYDRVTENAWNDPAREPLSTFSIDVDTASYANVRRYLTSGNLPPPDAVRIEELINYFTYDYAGPSGDDPLAFDTELTACPWNDGHYLLRVGVQARRIMAAELPPSNLVFLIDVSGSMEEANKLPLVKESLKLLAENMRQEDRISIVVYSGAAGQVLAPTSGARKDAIFRAIDNLEAGGSTAGGEGIELAYAAAKRAFIPGGNNRVVMASDGDFNVGASSDAALVRLIEEKRDDGIFLTVLGFGMGNYKDSKMQKLADSGNGNYAYVDTLQEAEKVLSRQMAGTLYTLAKDVKLQIEFNPATVSSYRLIGYEKRVLAARDFDDDAKDAGELGAGHSVTALYEIVPQTGTAVARDDLQYQQTVIAPAAAGGDLMTIKFRYKRPLGENSALIERAVPWKPVPLKQASADTRFAAAVAAWGFLLRDSEHRGDATWALVSDLAAGAKGRDADGYRAEFLQLVSRPASLAAQR